MPTRQIRNGLRQGIVYFEEFVLLYRFFPSEQPVKCGGG
jgi:hypothetical protein